MPPPSPPSTSRPSVVATRSGRSTPASPTGVAEAAPAARPTRVELHPVCTRVEPPYLHLRGRPESGPAANLDSPARDSWPRRRRRFGREEVDRWACCAPPTAARGSTAPLNRPRWLGGRTPLCRLLAGRRRTSYRSRCPSQAAAMPDPTSPVATVCESGPDDHGVGALVAGRMLARLSGWSSHDDREPVVVGRTPPRSSGARHELAHGQAGQEVAVERVASGAPPVRGPTCAKPPPQSPTPWSCRPCSPGGGPARGDQPQRRVTVVERQHLPEGMTGGVDQRPFRRGHRAGVGRVGRGGAGHRGQQGEGRDGGRVHPERAHGEPPRRSTPVHRPEERLNKVISASAQEPVWVLLSVEMAR